MNSLKVSLVLSQIRYLEGWPSASDIEQQPELARWFEVEKELAAKYPDAPNFVPHAHYTMNDLYGVRTQDLWEQYPDAETATPEQWRERLGAPPDSTAGDVTPGLGDRVDEAFGEGPPGTPERHPLDRDPSAAQREPFPETFTPDEIDQIVRNEGGLTDKEIRDLMDDPPDE